MATFILTGKYTPQALKDISPDRTKKALSVIKENQGAVQMMYATLGQNDLVFLLDFPGLEEAMKTSVALSKLTGIGFTTTPAVTVDVFDKMTAGL
ncbi:MAG: GYD domain-containing protein [Pirellulales bacterium]|nr:GYD domain-containing protein [Pirellulales bacterium]